MLQGWQAIHRMAGMGQKMTHPIDTIRREMVKAIATVEIARLRKPVAMCWNKPVQPTKIIAVEVVR